MTSASNKPSKLQGPRLSGPGATSIEPFQMPFQPGEVVLGKYRIERLIGTGGVGFVVAARHIGFDEVVALKFLRPEFATHAEAVKRFTIEGRASFKIKSEHVARILDVDTLPQGAPFIAMELLEGIDLRSLLDRCTLLAVEPAVDYALQVCEALSAAHALQIVHRDIKPENLFLTGPGYDTDLIKVLDFGISKVALTQNGRQTHQALTRVAVGTPPYMAPEQVRASSDLDSRADIWSLGCVLYELLSGTAVFDRMSLMQSCAAVLEEEPTPLKDLQPAVPVDLDAVIMRCLKKDAQARFQDIAELATALNPFGTGRFAAYPERCRAFLDGETTQRRSTPTALAPVAVARDSVLPRHSTGIVRNSTASRRMPSVAQGGRRIHTAPYPTALIPDAHLVQPVAPVRKLQGVQWPLALGLSAGLAFGAAYLLAHRPAPEPHLTSVAQSQPRTAITPARATGAPRPASPQPSAATDPGVATAPSSRIHGDVAPPVPEPSATPPLPEPSAAPAVEPQPPDTAAAAAPSVAKTRVKAHGAKTRARRTRSARRINIVTHPADEPDVGF